MARGRSYYRRGGYGVRATETETARTGGSTGWTAEALAGKLAGAAAGWSPLFAPPREVYDVLAAIAAAAVNHPELEGAANVASNLGPFVALSKRQPAAHKHHVRAEGFELVMNSVIAVVCAVLGVKDGAALAHHLLDMIIESFVKGHGSDNAFLDALRTAVVSDINTFATAAAPAPVALQPVNLIDPWHVARGAVPGASANAGAATVTEGASGSIRPFRPAGGR